MAAAGRYRASGECRGADGRVYPFSGHLSLLPGGEVNGLLTDGPVASGNWSGEGLGEAGSGSGSDSGSGSGSGSLSFLLIYNAEMPFLYTLRFKALPAATAGSEAALSLRAKGAYQLDGRRGLDASLHGKVRLSLTLETPIAAAAPSANPTLALPLPGSGGNRACEVRPVSGLTVPCSMCGDEEATLSFLTWSCRTSARPSWCPSPVGSAGTSTTR